MLKSARDAPRKKKRKTHFAPAGGQAKPKCAPTKWGARETERTNKKRVGAGAVLTRGRKPETKILELFLIVSRGGGGGRKNFSEYGKKCGEAALSKQNICSVLVKKCAVGAGVYQLMAQDARVCGRTASEKVTRNETRKCERKRTRKCAGTPEAVHPRPHCTLFRVYEFFAFSFGVRKKGEHKAPPRG